MAMLAMGTALALLGLALARQASGLLAAGQPGPAIKTSALACLLFFGGAGLLGMAGLRRLKKPQ